MHALPSLRTHRFFLDPLLRTHNSLLTTRHFPCFPRFIFSSVCPPHCPQIHPKSLQVQPGWLEPLMHNLAEGRNKMVMPQIDRSGAVSKTRKGWDRSGPQGSGPARLCEHCNATVAMLDAPLISSVIRAASHSSIQPTPSSPLAFTPVSPQPLALNPFPKHQPGDVCPAGWRHWVQSRVPVDVD